MFSNTFAGVAVVLALYPDAGSTADDVVVPHATGAG